MAERSPTSSAQDLIEAYRAVAALDGQPAATKARSFWVYTSLLALVEEEGVEVLDMPVVELAERLEISRVWWNRCMAVLVEAGLVELGSSARPRPRLMRLLDV